jgi:uncharacterized membrane protein YhhN
MEQQSLTQRNVVYRRLRSFIGAEAIIAAEKAIEKSEARRVSRLSQVLLLASIVSSFLYWSSLVLPVSGYLHAAIKWISIGTLTLIIVRLIKGRQDIFLLAALFFHSLGDIVLAHPYQDLLMYSIGPFLLGHIFYIFTFKYDLPAYHALKQNLSRAKKILIVAAFIYTSIMASILIPPLLDTHLVYPIIVYMLVVGTMVVLSTLPQYRSPWMTLGCWMYIISDSLIAINKFYTPLPPFINACSWPLYYIGQILISLGLMKEKNNSICFLIVHDYLSI